MVCPDKLYLLHNTLTTLNVDGAPKHTARELSDAALPVSECPNIIRHNLKQTIHPLLCHRRLVVHPAVDSHLICDLPYGSGPGSLLHPRLEEVIMAIPMGLTCHISCCGWASGSYGWKYRWISVGFSSLVAPFVLTMYQAGCCLLCGILRDEYVDPVYLGVYQRFDPHYFVFLNPGWSLVILYV